MIVYGMNVSLDGYIADVDGGFGWTEPAEDVHRFWNDQERASALDVYGRRLWETMRYWIEPDPALPEVGLEYARAWQATPRIVVSTTLESVDGGAQLVRDPADVPEVDGPVHVGGAGLAAAMIHRIDEFRPVVFPVAIGGGTPFFPAGVRLDLRLVESRAFDSGPVLLRYARA